MFYYTSGKSVLDQISDPEVLSKRVPRYKERFDALMDVRERNKDVGTYTTWGLSHLGGEGPFRRVASIPDALLGRLLELEPDLLISKKKFFAWLDRHPEYSTYRRPR